MLNRLKYYGVVFSLGLTMCSTTALAETITIPEGRSELVSVASDMTEVIVANPAIADAYVHDPRKVSVMGRQIGVTDVKIIGADGVLRNFTVNVGYDLPAIRKALNELLPNEQIGLEMLNTNLVLTGSVRDAAAAERAVRIVSEFVQPSAGPNAVSISNATPGDRFKVMNLLEITSGQQVMLRVRVGEMRRSAIKNLGLDVQAIKNGSDTVFSLATGGGVDAFLTDSALDFGGYVLGNDRRGFASFAFQNSSGNGVSALLEALERDNLFKVLAEPNLVSLSGEKSTFLAGGEVPIPVPQQLNQITIQYKPYGVSVDFTPFVLSENRIRIAVQPEVSEISEDGALEISGFFIPGFITRRAQTVVELSPGESFMIAGLIQDRLTSQVDSLPGIKEIPILGALFNSVAYQREESELVLAVTPYIVDPMVSSDVKLPTDDFRPATTMEMFFYGAIGSLHGNVDRISQTPTTEGPVGFMVD